jgi:hypothetical protein
MEVVPRGEFLLARYTSSCVFSRKGNREFVANQHEVSTRSYCITLCKTIMKQAI